MNKLRPLIYLLPLLIPMALAGVMKAFGGGPGMEDLVEDFHDENPKQQVDALDLVGDLRRPTYVEHVLPLLKDDHERVRRYAIRALSKMKNPQALAELNELVWEGGENSVDALDAMMNIGYPQALPYYEKMIAEHPNPKIQEKAAEFHRGLREGLNLVVCFYSLGNTIWNDLGDTINSQAMLFEPGRETALEHPGVEEWEVRAGENP